MKIINDSEQILNAMKNLNALEALEKFASEIRILEYEIHELIMSPIQQNDNLLFIFEGGIIFYVLQKNGQIISVGRNDGKGLLGEERLFDSTHENIYVEARTRVRMLAVPYSLCKKECEQNVAFLQLIIRKMLEKSNHERQFPRSSDTTKDKFLFYIKYLCPEHRMNSVNDVAETINCSCRQLHRVLRELTDEGVILHVGKGKYELGGRG